MRVVLGVQISPENRIMGKGGMLMRGVIWVVKHILSVAQALFILAIALFLPQICLWNAHESQKIDSGESSTTFKLGVENITDRNVYSKNFQDSPRAIALVTNNTGMDQEGNSTLDVLLSKGLPIKKILAPQGTFEKKSPAKNLKKIPLFALQSKKGHSLITKNLMGNIDTIMIDMQDSGMHYSGLTNTLLDVMKAASTYKKKCIILDRPNLLGWCMEGFCPEVPLRYGMTMGEMAHYYNKYVLRKPINLQVIPMTNYNRCVESGSMLACSLSPEIKNIDSCYGHSFLGLLGEVAPFDIGLGTDKAFQCILLPDKMKFPRHKWQELGLVLKDLGVESKVHRYYSARKKYHCSGLRLHIHDINHFSSFKTLLTILNFFKNNGVPLQFSPAFDQAMGSRSLRSLVQGSISLADLATHVNDDLQLFFNKACSCFLYKPYPKMVHV